MAFRDFSFPNVRSELGLTLAEENLFGDVVPLDLSQEFIIAPLLLKLKVRRGGTFGVFRGSSWTWTPRAA